ncbi:MAG TPA: phenylalanine--tRNA ligase subunit beta [Chromatiales bacterium]|nr:phenylalanine--tRNA ligase subunit beta [Chromatiales bacterium]
MKFSVQWLREWVNPEISIETLSKQLTMAGLEVDAVSPVAEDFSGVVVGEVLSVEAHPEADKLQICQVDVAQDTPLQIVCGARNVHAGMRVPTACVGALLPGGFKIKKAKLRGVASMGMLCSEQEIGLAESADGLMPLPADATIGANIRDYLQLDDVTLELGLTPNRSDCLSISGIAREVAVFNRCGLNEIATEAVETTIDEQFPVKVTATAACPRYLGRVIKGINPKAATPIWMQERLRRSGVRAISPVVDVTNYVMLELGQPMHAFALNKLSGGIEVRQAKSGESIKLLNDETIKLSEDTLVIADQNGALALAGVMGGSDSAVEDETVDLFLESAFFDPDVIAGKARRYGLHTDSSHRFERGVDYQLPRRAMERATQLLQWIVGGDVGPVTEVVNEGQLPKRTAVTLRASRLKRMLGIELAEEDVSEILNRLGMRVECPTDGEWCATAPSFRFDISIEADLVEEVARIVGYDNIPSIPPVARLQINAASETEVTPQQIRQRFVDRGYQEVITYSFVDEAQQSRLNPDLTAIKLANPISAEMSVMRSTLWTGLLQALSYNQNRQQKRIRLFEIGVRFCGQLNDRKEEKVISGVICGTHLEPQWGEKRREADFFDLKGDVEALLALAAGQRFTFNAEAHPALHPGQSAAICDKDGVICGYMGQLHPEIAHKMGLDGDAFLFEVSYDAVARRALPVFYELSKFPAVRRDIAVIVDENVSSQSIRDCIKIAAGERLQELQLFDLYQGKGVDSGRKSVALGLTLQEFSRTLTDTEIDSVVVGVLSSLNKNLGATLRE